MIDVRLLRNQTENVYDWTNKLVRAVPFDRWDIIPETIETCVTWQVGHLIMSHYFHSVMVIMGHQQDIASKFPMMQYADWFTTASPRHSAGQISPALLFDQLQMMQQKSLSVIGSLTSEQLQSDLEPTHIKHPIAKTKYEAIQWNINHTMYHCGQIGILKRIVDARYDFGLRI